jgi:GntR family transcriptional regulator/MocR family aminotransferase
MVQSPLGLSLQPTADEPLYRQIFDQVVDRVRSGALPPGFRLPPTRTLARALGTHRNTVVRAYEDLEGAGFVESTVGRGTFVAQLPRARLVPAVQTRDDARLPWSTLVSHAVTAETLGRHDRLTRGLGTGLDLVNLTRMQPSGDLLPDELLRRCFEHVLRTLGPRALGYGAREGLPRLREAIAADLARQGVPAGTDDLVVTSGSQQALDLVVRALANPGDPVPVDESTYTGALNVIAAAGARAIGVPSDDEGPSLESLERLARSGAKALYLMPNCHNPTGLTITAARREALVAWSHRAGVPIIEDDFVADLNVDGVPAPAAMRSLDGDVIYIGTFSKRLIPALRTGFVVAPAPLRPRLVALKYTVDLGNSELMQHALAEFLERGYLIAHLLRSVPEYRRRRDALEEALRRHGPRWLRWRRGERGVALWLPLPPTMDPRAVFEEAHRKGVLVSPSTLNTVEDRMPGGVRLTFCAEPVERILEGAKRFARALAAVTGRGSGAADAGGVGAI